MTQQFRIDSESLRDKINNLLPSQNRGSIGVDLTGSTTIIPIVDLTETAEGSALRQDLQSSLSLISATAFNVSNTTATVLNTTGYFRVFGNCNITTSNASGVLGNITMTDGATTKTLISFNSIRDTATIAYSCNPIDFIVKLEAGDSLSMTSSATTVQFVGNTRQLADISGNLVNP